MDKSSSTSFNTEPNHLSSLSPEKLCKERYTVQHFNHRYQRLRIRDWKRINKSTIFAVPSLSTKTVKVQLLKIKALYGSLFLRLITWIFTDTWLLFYILVHTVMLLLSMHSVYMVQVQCEINLLLHPYSCNILFTSTEPEGHRPSGLVLIRWILHLQGYNNIHSTYLVYKCMHGLKLRMVLTCCIIFQGPPDKRLHHPSSDVEDLWFSHSPILLVSLYINLHQSLQQALTSSQIIFIFKSFLYPIRGNF